MIKIDNEFEKAIPKLRDEEFKMLKDSILKEGCRDPLVIWGETGILVDGHNRYKICTDNDIQYRIQKRSFDSRESVLDWIDTNQLGRRNLHPDDFFLILGRLYNRLKKAQNDGGKDTPKTTVDQNELRLSTAETLSQKHGVSPATVKRAGQYATAVETVSKATPEFDPKTTTRTAVVSAAKIIEADPLSAAEVIARGEKEILQKAKEIQAEKRNAKEAVRETRREENRVKVATVEQPEQIIETGAKFATIVIDPPWDWGDEGDVNQMGRAKPDYATMSIEQIASLPVADLADFDCHLYCWITNRSLPKGFALLNQWGFRYITLITWHKPSFGLGNYFRGQTEHVLFGVKGSQMLKRKDVGTVFNAPRGSNGHSSKPEEFYKIVESCSPGPFLEMFSRVVRDGWTTWGEGR